MKITIEEYLIIKKKFKDTLKVRIISNSMEPFIHTGEEILIQKFDPQSFKSYMPIVFWEKDRLICHFFIKKILKDNKIYYVSKSLSNKYYDELISEEFILGEVIEPKVSIMRKIIMHFVFYKAQFKTKK